MNIQEIYIFVFVDAIVFVKTKYKLIVNHTRYMHSVSGIVQMYLRYRLHKRVRERHERKEREICIRITDTCESI